MSESEPSFQRLVDVIATGGDVSLLQNDDAEAEPSKGEGKFVIHQELIEASSQFFSNAFGSGKWSWREGEEKAVRMPVEAPVLEMFANWLYRAEVDKWKSWDLLIESYIFAITYSIQRYAADLITVLLDKYRETSWIPSLEQIQRVYENTNDECGLRTVITECFADNTWDADIDAESVLKVASVEFVRDYAILASQKAREGFDRSPRQATDISKYYKPFDPTDPAWKTPLFKSLYHVTNFKDTVKFTLGDSAEPGIVHLAILCRATYPVSFSGFETQPIDARQLQKSVFKVFAFWLYYNDLTDIQLDCERTNNMRALLECYEAALFLLECNLDGLTEKSEPPPANSKLVLDMLHFQAAQFKDDIIDALVETWKRCEYLPSNDEITFLYQITKPGDPLRKLVADIYVWSGVNCPENTQQVEFLRDLNNSLIASHAVTRASLNEVYTIFNRIKPMTYGYSFGSGFETRGNDREFLRVNQRLYKLDACSTQEYREASNVFEINPPSAPYDKDMNEYHNADSRSSIFDEALNTLCTGMPASDLDDTINESIL